MGIRIAYVEPVILIYMICMYLTMLTGQQLLLRKVCLGYFNNTYCDTGIKNGTNEVDQNMVQASASQWSVYIMVCKSLPALISTFIYGYLSDVVGRKKILVIPIVGEAICNSIYLLNVYYFNAHLWYLLIANVISGVSGTFGTVLMLVSAYIADTSGKDTRTKRVTIMGIMIAIAMIFSSVCGGLILKIFGYLVVYSVAMAFYILLLVYLWFLKESFEHARESTINKAELIKKMMEVFGIVIKKRDGFGRKMIHLFLACLFFMLLTRVGFALISVFFLKHQPLNFDAEWIGYFNAEYNALKIVGATVITIILIQKFKWNDSSIIIVTASAFTATMVSLAFASYRWQVFVCGLCFLGVGAGIPATQAGLTKLVSQEEQGKMCSFIANMEVLCTLISTLVFPVIYAKTVHISPSFVLFIMALISFVSLITAIVLRVYEKRMYNYLLLDEADDEVPSVA